MPPAPAAATGVRARLPVGLRGAGWHPAQGLDQSLAHLAEHPRIDVVEGVAGLVVAGVVGPPGRAAELRRLRLGLGLARAGIEHHGRDAGLRKGGIVGAAAPALRSAQALVGRKSPFPEEARKRPADVRRDAGSGLEAAAQEPARVGGAHHVEVDVDRDPPPRRLVEGADVVARAEEPALLRAPERKPDRPALLREAQGRLEDRGGPARIVVDAGPFGNAVEVGAHHHDVPRGEVRRLRKDVAGGAGARFHVDRNTHGGALLRVRGPGEGAPDLRRRAENGNGRRPRETAAEGAGAVLAPLVHDHDRDGAGRDRMLHLDLERAGAPADEGDAAPLEAGEILALAGARGRRQGILVEREVDGLDRCRDIRGGGLLQGAQGLPRNGRGARQGEDGRHAFGRVGERELLEPHRVARLPELRGDVVGRAVVAGGSGGAVAAMGGRDLQEGPQVREQAVRFRDADGASRRGHGQDGEGQGKEAKRTGKGGHARSCVEPGRRPPTPERNRATPLP